MKHILCSLLLLFSFSGYCKGDELQPSNKPNQTQRLMQQRGYGMFIHFGINTFSELEWSDGTIPADRYNPTDLDCEQWIRTARDAGFRYVLLTTKHHDGFCLWDSRYTDYDVASSPVKTDVVRAVSDACRKYGLQFAIYYSLWDRHEPLYKEDFGKYLDYMCNQLTELLTNYGDVCEVWFDGAWDKKPEEWQLDRLYSLIKKYQPNCAVGTNHTIVLEGGKRVKAHPDQMIEDNKYFFQYFPSDFRLWDPEIAHIKDKKQYLHQGKSYYLPFEHTICISKNWTWFSKQEPGPCRDLDELEELFYRCTANGNTLVVNVPPCQTGQIRTHEANTIITLGQRLGLQKDKPHPQNGELISLDASAEASSVYPSDDDKYLPQYAFDGGMKTRWASNELRPTLTVRLGENKTFTKIMIFEYQDAKGGNDGFSSYRTNRIQKCSIEVLCGNCWSTVYLADSPMDDCKVIRFPRPITAERTPEGLGSNSPAIYL